MELIKVAFSLDCTGSMRPALKEAQRSIKEVSKKLFDNIPELEVAFICHTDYGDENNHRWIDFTRNEKNLYDFLFSYTAFGGNDSDEFYEKIIHDLPLLDWSNASKKIFVLVGDAEPHKVGYNINYNYSHRSMPAIKNTIDWKEEARKRSSEGIIFYPTQCLGNNRASYFYETLASMTNGIKLDLHQLSNILELMEGVIYKQTGQLDHYEERLITERRINRSLSALLEQLRGGAKSTRIVFRETDLEAVPPARFQILHVDEKEDIKSFIEKSGAVFHKGRGFYEFSKRETVQEHKEIVLRDKTSGDMWTGEKARAMIGLGPRERARISPVHLDQYDVFIQSTSLNRILVPGTRFLYET